MKYIKFDKPKIMFSKAGKIYHPHIIAGRVDDKYVSMNVTHHRFVKDHKTKKLFKNLNSSFLVTDQVYLRDKDKYFYPDKDLGEWSVSNDDRKKVENIIKNFDPRKLSK